MADAGPNQAEDGDQSWPEDHADPAGLTHSDGHSSARPVREYRMNSGDRVGNAIFTMLARTGIGPAHLLTTRGRKTGQPRTIPVILAKQDNQLWPQCRDRPATRQAGPGPLAALGEALSPHEPGPPGCQQEHLRTATASSGSGALRWDRCRRAKQYARQISNGANKDRNPLTNKR
jgi:F420H(2)-dependent quinone reductase